MGLRRLALAPNRDMSSVPRSLLAVVIVSLTLAGCGGVAEPPSPTARPTAVAPTPRSAQRAPTAEVAGRCVDGRLTVGDLPAADEVWAAGVQAATERATAWRSDARLVSLRVGCEPLESGFRWQGTFYAESAQSFFLSDTGQTKPAEVDPASVPTLSQDRISFHELRLSLARAGYADSAKLSAANGVEVQLNAATDPFGPPGTPQAIVYHVAIDDQGEVRDLFVSGADWTIYQY
jgi:hypothetical protein